MNEIRVGVVQMVSSSSVEDNFYQAEALVAECIEEGASLILLPENCFMFSAKKFLELARKELEENLIQQFLSRLCNKHECYIVAGSVPMVAKEGRVFSTLLVYGPSGECLQDYKKIHLFDVDVDDNVGSYRESDFIQAGTETAYFEIDDVKIGLSICYDLRFPELYRALSAAGCEILLVPSAFTYATGEKHWEVLLRARAIENQCYVLAANQGGEHDTGSGTPRRTYGHSMIIDEQGRCLAVRESGQGTLIHTLDLSSLRISRERMPVLSHRRL